MEGKKHVGSSSSSSSSFTNELFGSRDSSASSGIIGALFSPSSKALGKEAIRYEVPESNKNSGNESFKPKTDGVNGKEGEKYNGETGSIYQEQRMQQPCNLSSSIYYGGQDIYHPPQGVHNSTIKKDVGEDDSGSASRGNWWQGSLYY